MRAWKWMILGCGWGTTAQAAEFVSVSISGLPPSQVSCLLVGAAGVPAGQVVFEPSDATMTQEVMLPPRVSVGDVVLLGCSSKPLFQEVGAGKPKADVSWRASQGDSGKPPVAVNASRSDRSTISLGPLDGSNWSALATVTVKPVVASDARALLAAMSPRSTGGGGRSALAAPIPPLLQDTLEILTEIVVEKAKEGAFAAIKDEVKWLVCETLTAETSKLGELGFLPEGTEWEGPLLPHTCDAISALTLADLSNAGDSLTRALRQDGTRLGLGALEQLLGRLPTETDEDKAVVATLTALLETARPTLLSLAAAPQEIEESEVQALIVRLGQTLVGQLDGGKGTAASANDLVIAFAAAGKCMQLRGCDAAQVGELLNSPGTWLTGYTGTAQAGRLTELVIDLLQVLSPGPQTTGRTTFRSGVDVLFSLTEEVLAAFPAKDDEGKKKRAHAEEALDHVQGIIHGIIDGEIATTVTDSVGLLDDVIDIALDKNCPVVGVAPCEATCEALIVSKGTIGRVIPWVTALATNARSLSTEGKTEAEIAALREARKDTLKQLIAASTNRQGRDGQWVASLGVDVGVSGGLLISNAIRPSDRASTQKFSFDPFVSLPVGFAIQRLPRHSTGEGKNRTFGGPYGNDKVIGFHAMATVFDLGRFATRSVANAAAEPGGKSAEQVAWGDLLTPGLRLGFMPPVGRGASSFTVAVDARFVPVKDDFWNFFVGLSFSYYVPIFDFN